MNLLQLYNASKQYGSKILFDNAGFSINQGEHVGVIGPNGAGKSTLFKIIVGIEHLNTGEVTKANGLRIGYLEQESDWTVDVNAEDYLKDNCIKPIWELKQIGLGLGLQESHFSGKLTQLSGGYRMRMKLLYLIGLEPDIMLLDEPTNFLDLESILTLENFLQNHKQAFLLISHDREFLRRTTEYTLEVEAGDIVKFPGHIDDYFEQKAELKRLLEAKAVQIENKRKQIQDFVDKFRAKATKARQAQSRLKSLDRLEQVEIKKLPPRAVINLPTATATGKEILSLTNANLGYSADRVILKNVNLTIERGQKIGIVGFNGAGKSTLLKSIAEKIQLITGELKWGYQVRYSYFAQHLADDLLDNDTVLDALQRKAHKDNMAQDFLNMAGSLLFSGDSVYKKIKVLSGGEKTRVALGQVLLQKNPLLLLDEPTNHLDFDTVNALAVALSEFNGTVILVSHDRTFLKQVTTQIVEVRNGTIEKYLGSYDEYLWSLEKGILSERIDTTEVVEKVATNSDNQEKKFNYKEETKRLNSEIKEFERKILKTEELLFRQAEKQVELTSSLITAQGQQAQEIAKQAAAISSETEKMEEALMTHMENLEIKKQELAGLVGK
ncbi:MAG: ABC-F family ATP-binding cassette domain-containing protein [Bdellovibrionota bacterium]